MPRCQKREKHVQSGGIGEGLSRSGIWRIFFSLFVNVLSVALVWLPTFRSLGTLFFLGCEIGQIFRSVCCRLRYIGNQMYHRRIHYQWLFELLDVGYQKSYLGALLFTSIEMADAHTVNIAFTAVSHRFRFVCRKRGSIRTRRLLCWKRNRAFVQEVSRIPKYVNTIHQRNDSVHKHCLLRLPQPKCVSYLQLPVPLVLL